jgi:hypothetical protein
MDPDSSSAQGSGQRQYSGGIWTTVFLAIFLILLFLLGRSMIEHRFFRGERVHHNGSVGQ